MPMVTTTQVLLMIDDMIEFEKKWCERNHVTLDQMRDDDGDILVPMHYGARQALDDLRVRIAKLTK